MVVVHTFSESSICSLNSTSNGCESSEAHSLSHMSDRSTQARVITKK